MRIFRVFYKDRDGKQQEAAKWYIELRDHLQTVRRFPGFTDKTATEALGQQIYRLISCKVSGEQPTPALTRWLEGIPSRLRQRFAEIGLIDPERANGGKRLSEHLADFQAFLRDKGDTPSYVKLTVYRIKQTFEGCKFIYWMDISAGRVQRHLAELRDNGNGISAQTFNYYLRNLQQFCRWMIQNRRASESPLQHLKGLNVRTDRRHDRRALELDEIRRLLEATAAEPERFGMTGAARAMLYRLAIETGLRANELRSLTVSSFDLAGRTVTLQAAYSKHRRQDVLPLRPDTANALQGFLSGKMPNVKAFNVPPVKTAKMLKTDLQAAGIPYVDDSGLYADFHSLRHTSGSLLAAAGVHPKVAQTLMRHADINLTMSRYTHTLAGQETQAIAALPDLSAPSSRQQRATGTDDKNVLALCLALSDGKHRTPVDGSGQVNRIDDTETAFSNAPEGIQTPNIRPQQPLPLTGHTRQIGY